VNNSRVTEFANRGRGGTVGRLGVGSLAGTRWRASGTSSAVPGAAASPDRTGPATHRQHGSASQHWSNLGRVRAYSDCIYLCASDPRTACTRSTSAQILYRCSVSCIKECKQHSKIKNSHSKQPRDTTCSASFTTWRRNTAPPLPSPLSPPSTGTLAAAHAEPQQALQHPRLNAMSEEDEPLEPWAVRDVLRGLPSLSRVSCARCRGWDASSHWSAVACRSYGSFR